MEELIISLVVLVAVTAVVVTRQNVKLNTHK